MVWKTGCSFLGLAGEYGIKTLGLWATLFIVLCFSARVAKADEAVQGVIKIKQVVVSASRMDKKLVEVPASISLITSEDIEEMGAKNIVDIVRNIPGVVADSSTRDEVTFRGNRGPQSPGVLVLVDGVPANTGLGNYVDYDAIPISDIERVEVLRSSGSIAYGPDAARGMINIITKKGKAGPPRVRISTAYGSWDTAEASANITGQSGLWDYAFGGSMLDTGAYEDDEKQRSAARLGLGLNVSEYTRLGFNLAWRDVDYKTIYGKTKWQVDNYRTESIFPTSATDPTLIHHRENQDENLTTSFNLKHERGAVFVNALLSFDVTDHVYEYLKNRLNPAYSKTSSYYDYRESQDQDRIFASFSGGYHFEFGEMKYTPSFGVESEKTDYDQSRTYPWSPAPYPSSQNSAIATASMDYQRERWGAFWANEFDFSEQWELNVSGRVDEVDYDVSNREPKNVSKDHTDYSWNVTPAFHPGPESTIFASASKSYWYPVAYYYKYAMEKDSPLCRAEDLGPEEYLTYELGYKHYFGSKLSLALTGYLMDVKDKYLSLYDGASWQGYKNVGKSEHEGIELEASGRLSSYLGYRLQGAYQHAKWDEATFRAYVWGATPAADTQQNLDISGYKVPHIPEFTGSFGLDFYFLEYFKVSADVNYYGTQQIDVLNRYEMEDYVTCDAMISYTRGDYKIWLLGNNIFDREVENQFNEGGKRNADGTPNHLYYPTDGRYMKVGVTVNF